jgi:hypothetical protein
LFGHFWDYLKWITFPFKPEAGLAGARAVTAVAFLGMGLWALARRDRVSSFLFLWTLACLAPLSLFAHGIDRRYAYLVSVPFSLFVVAGLKSAGDHFALESRGSKIALALPLLLAVPALAMVTRSGQDWAHDQTRIYEQIYAAVPEVCGPLTPGSRIVLIDSPGFDLVGIDTQVALNFSYDRVTVERYGSRETVPPSAPGQTTCTARWIGETFRAD